MHTSYKKNFTPRSEKDLEKSFHTRPGQKLGGPCRIKNTGGCHLQQGAVSSPKLTWGEWLASFSPSLFVESSSLILVIRGVYLSPLSTLAIYIRCQLGTYVAIQKFKNSDFDIHPCGWDTCFYLMGSSSLLWTLAWIFLAHDNPKLHPNITAEVRMQNWIPTSLQRWECLESWNFGRVVVCILRGRQPLLKPGFDDSHTCPVQSQTDETVCRSLQRLRKSL